MDATSNHLIAWLLDGDAAIQYQVYCDLLGQQRPDIRARIVTEGWGAQFLAARQPAGHWGRGFPGCRMRWRSSRQNVARMVPGRWRPNIPARRISTWKPRASRPLEHLARIAGVEAFSGW